jgi:MFS family permease
MIKEVAMKTTMAPYPVTLKIDLPDRALNRLTTAFRILMIVPIAIVLGLLSGPVLNWELGAWNNWRGPWTAGVAATGILVLPVLVMVLFRRKYPRWWFDWNVQLVRFTLRVGVYAMLLTDVYPSTDEEQAVHLKMPYPDAAKDLSPWMPLVKWFLAIPHLVVLAFLAVAAWVCAVIAWFAILFTGRYPKDLAEFVVGVMRWGVRVSAYAFLLVTDVYPPFTLD